MSEQNQLITDKEKLVPLDALKPVVKWRLRPSEMFPTDKVIRAGQLVLRILSTNDKKYTVSLELVGVVLENDAAFEQLEENKNDSLN